MSKKRCRICKSGNNVNKAGRCHLCQTAQDAVEAGMSYGKLYSIAGGDSAPQSAGAAPGRY